jgi:hypothetical protein
VPASGCGGVERLRQVLDLGQRLRLVGGELLGDNVPFGWDGPRSRARCGCDADESPVLLLLGLQGRPTQEQRRFQGGTREYGSCDVMVATECGHEVPAQLAVLQEELQHREHNGTRSRPPRVLIADAPGDHVDAVGRLPAQPRAGDFDGFDGMRIAGHGCCRVLERGPARPGGLAFEEGVVLAVDAAVGGLVVVDVDEGLPSVRVVAVPVHGRLEAAVVEVHLRLPAGQRLELGGIEGVAEVVAQAVLDVTDLAGRRADESWGQP